MYTVAINGFLISNHLGEGGVTGLMTIFYYLLKIAPSLTNIVLNGLLLLIGWKLLNKQTVFYTLYTITMISVFLKLIGSMRFPLHDPLVAALIGGALMGVAMGFIMKGEGTLAGSTILARIVNKFFGIKTGSAMLCFDLMVAIPSAVIIGFENMLLTIVELYLSAVILNKLLAQFVEKRSLTIISERFEELASALSDATKQGVTIIDGHGYVSGQKKQLLYMGTAQIVMPENYIAMFNAPTEEQAEKTVKKAEPAITEAIARIKAGEPFSAPRSSLYDRFMSGPINPIFYRFFVKADAFYTNSTCIGCGKCAEKCPLNNIILKSGRPVWGKNCTHCMACICYCPAEAIEYGKKSTGKPRYRFERLKTK